MVKKMNHKEMNIDYLWKKRNNDVQETKVNKFVEEYKKGAVFPLPIFNEGKTKMTDGNHRVAMMKKLGFKKMLVKVV